MIQNRIESLALKFIPVVQSLVLAAVICLINTAGGAEISAALYKSTNQGASWFPVGQGLPPDVRINALDQISGVIIAGTDQGLYRSHNTGTNWTVVRAGVGAEARVLCLAMPARRIVAGTEKHGALVSDDFGMTWKLANSGLTDLYVRSLLSAGPKLYAGTDSQGVFVSENFGVTWTKQGAGLPDSLQVFDLAAVNGTLFAGLYSKGLYRWDNERELWVKSGTVKPLEIVANGKTLVAGHNPGGVFFSNDQGETWLDGNIGLPRNVPVWTLAANEEQVFVGASGKVTFDSDEVGLFTSRTHGATWARSDTGIPPAGAAISFLVTKEFVLAGIALRTP